MRKQSLRLMLTVLGLHALIMTGCQYQGTTKSTPPPISFETSSPISGLAATVTSTKTSTPKILPTYTPTATLAPISFNIISTDLQRSGNWNLATTFSDQSAPEIIIGADGEYRLDPDFQVDTIDLLYEWWGLGDPVLDYQRIERRGSNYWRGDTAISRYDINRLIQSINQLHPQSQMSNAITHTDDYPIWAIELTNSEGMHVLLYSNSNGPHYAPWNVIYNGQIYTQFSGKIAQPLARLFQVSEGQPMAWTAEGGTEEGYLVVDSTGWPAQLTDGFSGLVAVQSGFNYWPDGEKGEIHGYLRGRSSIAGMGNMIIGSITELENIDFEVGDGQIIPCALTSLPSDDPAALIWEFVCPTGKTNRSGRFQFPISVAFRTDKNKTYVSTGELFGTWERTTVLPATRYPEEIGQVLAGEPSAQDLMTDHQIVVLKFNAAVDQESGSMGHRWTADLVLLGQAKLQDRVVPYSVTIPVEIIDRELVRWDLDRVKLQALLKDTLNQAITRRFLNADPNLALNLYYGESAEYPIVSGMDLQPCGNLPIAADGLPSDWQALRGFSFNQSWDFYGMQIVMIGDELRLVNMSIQPSAPEDAIWTSILPAELQPENAPQFQKIDLWPWSPVLAITWEADLTATERKIYSDLLQSWPGNKEIHSWGVLIDRGSLAITKDGNLEIVACKAK